MYHTATYQARLAWMPRLMLLITLRFAGVSSALLAKLSSDAAIELALRDSD